MRFFVAAVLVVGSFGLGGSARAEEIEITEKDVSAAIEGMTAEQLRQLIVDMVISEPKTAGSDVSKQPVPVRRMDNDKDDVTEGR